MMIIDNTIQNIITGKFQNVDDYVYRIYGKHKTSKKYSAYDAKRGILVVNLIYASMFKAYDGAKLVDKVKSLNLLNPEYNFEIRAI